MIYQTDLKNKMSNVKSGYRGYIGSRPYQGDRTPQHVQNLVIRDFCQRNKLEYFLSATEYAMPGCYMILEAVAEEATALHGVVLYSIFMLPKKNIRRMKICTQILESECSIYAALENIHIRNLDDLSKNETMLRLNQHIQVNIT